MVKQTVSFKVADKECCNFIKMSFRDILTVDTEAGFMEMLLEKGFGT